MRSIIEAIFGEYVPVTYSALDAGGEVVDIIPAGLAGVDWTYVLGVVGFFLVLWCILRIIGGVISKC